MGTNSYVTKLKAQIDRAITQRDHWKQLAETRNSIVVTEVCPESRSVEEYIIDADSVRSSWRLIREYRAQIEALRVENGRLRDKYDRDVYGLNNEGDPIGGDPAGGYANDNARLRAELEAIKGQQPVAIANKGDGVFWVKWTDAGKPLRGPGIKLYTTPQPGPDVRALVEALEQCAASLAWNCFGECRAVHAVPIMPAAKALDAARAALAAHRQTQGVGYEC